MKEMWKELGNLLNTKRKNNGNLINKLIINNKQLNNDKDIANALNTHFATIGKNLADKVMPEENNSFKTYLHEPISNSLFLRPTDNDEILNEINQLKHKSTLDVKVTLLKYVKHEIVKGLVIIYNKSFTEGQFPELLKIAKVIPIHKGDDATNPNNYRPISLLSVFDKLLEKLMLNRLNPFLNKNNILYKYQFGFRKNHATTHALTEVIDYIYKSLDEGNYVFGIYIDLKKAFDTVEHKILLYKLQYYGIRGLALEWFKSYLSNRKQFVLINDTYSNNIDLCEYGVPQGSVSGPILFLLFINDIYKSLQSIIIKLFADDTNCFLSGNDFNLLERQAELELNKLQKWVNANKLTINFDPKKSSYCIFKPNNRNLPVNFDRGLKMGQNMLRYKDSTIYLGLILDRSMTWESHIKELQKKIVKYTGIFSKVRHCLPEACRKTVYHAFIHSRLNYASEIYVNTTRKYIQPLISTQNKILRILQFQTIRTNINKVYKDFGILKLKDLHKFNICCIVHKFIHFPDMLPDAVSEMFCTNAQVHNYDTRHKRDIHPLKTKTKSYGEKTISYQGRTCWNTLPNDLKENMSGSQFKNKLKLHFLNNY